MSRTQITMGAHEYRLELPRGRRWERAFHIPTGTVVEFGNALSKTEALRQLQIAVNERSVAA